MQTKKRCLTLAIETSCDETSAAVLLNGRQVLANVISSQIPLHQKYGGVVPEIASRKHIENVLPVIDEALQEAGVTLADIDVVGVTYGPGLVGALLVGVAAAKTLAYASDKPLIAVNHLEGHIFANFISHPELEPPFAALVVSGGHTSLVHVKDYNSFSLLGQTVDDAAGEAFDKVARVLKLPYPGGPHIDRLAKEGNGQAIAFPRALAQKNSMNFSFSGLKSAVLNYLNSATQKGETIVAADVAASFQSAVVDVLVTKAMQACEICQSKKLVLAGGVAANSALKKALAEACQERGYALFYPEPVLCTDNAAMIASRAHYQYQEGLVAELDLNAVPSLKLIDANSVE